MRRGVLQQLKLELFETNEHMLRVDEETDKVISSKTAKKLIEACLKIINDSKIDVIIFEDYDKGVLTPEIIKALTAEAKKRRIPVTVDPKLKGFFNYPGVDLYKPNIQELREGLQRDIDLPMGLPEALNELHDKLSPKISITTLGAHGMWIHCPEGENTDATNHRHIKSRPSNVIDVSGAGDTVIATASLMLAAGATPLQIAEVANIAAGQVCEHSGVVTVDLEKLIVEV